MKPRPPGLAYRLLTLPLVLFWWGHALAHGRKHALVDYLRLRFVGRREVASARRIWVHASSVGEVRAISPLVRALLERDQQIVFTSFTATGYRAIEQGFGDAVGRDVIPVDFCWTCRRFFTRHDIRLGLVMETELWPELLYQAARRQIPLLLVNARLSARSTDTGFFVRRLLRGTLAYFTRILVRNQNDRELFLRLAANPERVRVIGNLKSLSQDGPAPQRLVERDYLLLASSHADEELQFLRSRPETLRAWLVVIAPRHPPRAGAIEKQLEQLGMPIAVRSRGDAISAQTAVYLADTLGELQSLMAFARVVVMGGSFGTIGGHNLLEAAALGCATLTGPSDTNIREDIKLLGPGVIQVGDFAQCWRVITELLDDPVRAQALGREASTLLARQPDVIESYLAAINAYL